MVSIFPHCGHCVCYIMIWNNVKSGFLAYNISSNFRGRAPWIPRFLGGISYPPRTRSKVYSSGTYHFRNQTLDIRKYLVKINLNCKVLDTQLILCKLMSQLVWILPNNFNTRNAHTLVLIELINYVRVKLVENDWFYTCPIFTKNRTQSTLWWSNKYLPFITKVLLSKL